MLPASPYEFKRAGAKSYLLVAGQWRGAELGRRNSMQPQLEIKYREAIKQKKKKKE